MNYSHLIPEGYEINEDDNFLVTDGDYFIWNNELHRFIGYTGKTIEYTKEIGVKEVLKKTEKPISPEEKINYLKKKARDFVDKHISNPSNNTYEKFEAAFIKDDDFGK